MRLNHMYPPFDNVDARKALLYLIDQEEFMKASFGNPKYYKEVSVQPLAARRWRMTRTPLGLRRRESAKAKELFKKSGYDGRPVTVLHATNIDFHEHPLSLSPSACAMPASMRAACLVRLGRRHHAARRQDPTGPGRLEYLHYMVGCGSVGNAIAWSAIRRPATRVGLAGRPTTCTKKLRDKWAAAGSLDEQKAVAREMQSTTGTVPHVWLRSMVSPVAYRKNSKAWGSLEVILFWNVEKT